MEMKFFDGMQDGYMEYGNTAGTGFAGDNKTPAVAASPVEKDKGVFVTFAYDGSIDSVENKNDLIEIRGDESNKDKVRVIYMTSNDTELYVFRIEAKQDLGKGTNTWIDFALKLSDDKVYPFVIDFGGYDGGNSEGGNQQNSALGDVDRDGNTLIVKSVNNVGDIIELPIDWRDDWGGNIQNIGLTSGVLNDLKSFNKDVFVACRWGVRLTLPKEVIADMEGKVTGNNKLWVVTDYRNQDAPDEEGGKAVAFRTKLYTGVTPANLTAYTLPTGQNHTFGMDFEKGNSDYVLYCPNENNTDLVKQNNVTVTKKDYDDSDMTCVSFSVDCDGDFVLAPSDYTIQREWPWYGSEGSKFDGMKAALEESNTAARNYVDQYLVDSTGHVKFGDNDTTGISLKDGKDYSAAEVATIKAAIMAFRNINWEQRDPLGNVQGVQIENDWTDCFGRYLAELAGRVGISLWGDYPSGDNAGVFMTLTGGSRLQLATDNAYGVLAYDESVNVKADEQAATYKVPYDRNYYAFAVTRTDDKRITSVKVENADCQEMAENGEVYGQKCTVANGESNSFEVNTYNNGWSISNEIAKSYFEINVDRWDEEFELTFIINYVSDSNDTETAEDKFTIKFVEPVCDWTFNNGSKPTNASELLNVFYNKGYRFPELESYAAISDGELLSANGFDLHLAFPMKLKKWETGCGDDWDYKVEIDEAKGTVTVKVNYGSAERWDAAARNMLETDAFVDGVYFSYWFGGSPYAKSVRYGMNLYDVLGDNISTTTIDKLADTLNNTKLVSNYYHSNSLDMAQLNKQNATTSLLTISDKETYLVSIAMDDEQADKNMGNAKYRYALLINVEPTASMAVKMEGTGLPKVTPERMRVTNIAKGWAAIVPQKATDSIFLRSEDYTTTSNGTYIADLTVDAPTGYKLVSWSADWREDNDDTTKMPIHLYKTQVNNVIITWENTTTGEELTESVVVEAGSTQSWMDTLANGTVTVNKPQTVFGSVSESTLSDNGITVEYNEDSGYFHTTVDASGVKDVTYLTAGVTLTVPESLKSSAKYFRVLTPGGSDNPTAQDATYGTNQVTFYDSTEKYDISNEAKLTHPFMLLNTLEVNGLTVYFADNQHYHITLVQWLDENENVLGYSYVYGRNGDFVTSVPTETTPEVNKEVDAPTLEWNGVTDPGFTCDRNPQTGGNGSKVFFQFGMKNQNGMPEGGWVIYLPYEYFGDLTWEKARTQTAKPEIYHYFDESCSESNREVLYGEYTLYGVMFKTTSFSPFVVDCSAAADATSGTHRYYTTAAKADSPETFDGGIALYGALAVTSLTGMAYVGKKRED